MRRAFLPVLLAPLALPMLAGCTAQDAGSASAAPALPTAAATLYDGQGVAHGTATFSQTADGVRLVIAASGLSAGPHGLHVHMVGKCDAPGFTTAGGHWNPAGHMHGKDNPQGAHLGDLPNLEVLADGTGQLDATIAGAQLTDGATPLLDADGSAVVIHATADDYRTDPAGNSGARIACGVLARS